MKARIEIDFARPSLVSVDAMQCDTLTRELEVQMLQDGEEYDPTEDFTSAYGFSVDYVKKANGIRGRYEKMPDETTDAVIQTGTKLLVRIAPAVLTAAGRVILNIRIYKNSTGETLRSFPIVLNVIPAAVGDSQPDEDYWNIKSLADVTAALNDCVAYSSQTGKTEEQKAQARTNIGAMEATNMPKFRKVTSPLFDVAPPQGSNVTDVFLQIDRENGKLSVSKDDENNPAVVIEGVGAPEDANDAANKAYVDAQIAAIDIETDVSDAYAAAAQQDPTLTPLAYLAELPSGRYKMYAEGSNYRCENIPVADSSTDVTSEIKEVTDEGFSYRYVYNAGRREVAVFEENGTHYDTPLSARSPGRDIEVVTRGFLLEKLADPFTRTTEYAAGDYCTHDGKLYRAKQDIAAGPVWDAALWDEVTVGGEVEEVNRQQKDMLGNIAAGYDSTKTYSTGEFCIKDEKLFRCVIQINAPEPWTLVHWERCTVGEVMSLLSELSFGTVKRYGVKFTGSASAGERLYDAAGKVAGVGTDTETAVNDFDNIEPWASMRRCNTTVVNGERVPTYFEGEQGFDNVNNDVFVYVPLFYYYRSDDDSEHVISSEPLAGYRAPQKFRRSDGTLKDHTFLAAYSAGVDADGVPVSRPGYWANNISLNRWMTLLNTIHTANDLAPDIWIEGTADDEIIRVLLDIEFATRDHQTVMKGATSMRYASDIVAAGGTNQCTVAPDCAAGLVVGQAIAIGTSDKGAQISDNVTVTAINTETGVITLASTDGSDVIVSEGNFISSRPWKSGACDGVLTPSGSPGSNATGNTPCKYRGIENPWGNQHRWRMDYLQNNYQPYVLTAPTMYTGAITEEYEEIAYAVPQASGYEKSMGYDPNHAWCRIGQEIGGSSTTYFADFYNAGMGLRALLIGGHISSGTQAGPRFCYTSNAPSNSNWNTGAALSPV